LKADGTPLAGSELIDSGEAPSPVRDTDLLGNERIQGDAIDIGAIEASP